MAIFVIFFVALSMARRNAFVRPSEGQLEGSNYRATHGLDEMEEVKAQPTAQRAWTFRSPVTSIEV